MQKTKTRKSNESGKSNQRNKDFKPKRRPQGRAEENGFRKKKQSSDQNNPFKSRTSKKRWPNDQRRKKRTNRPSDVDRQGEVKEKSWAKYVNTGEDRQELKVYEPHNQFEDFFLNQELLQRIKGKGYLAPTQIQDHAIPVILDGDDLVGVAGTGTGKTAAFMIPLLQVLTEEKNDHHALIIAPTRELAQQINDEFRSLTKGLGLFSTCLIGGSSVRESIRSLGKVNHLVIGTPGRLMDMHRQGFLSFDDFKVLVLDEFDRMLDMGFKDEMLEIDSMMNNKEQTLLFSATVDSSQRKLIKKIIGGGTPKEIHVANDTQKTDAIHQDVLLVKGQDKFKLLTNLLGDYPDEKVILFCETKRKAEKILDQLKHERFRADAIHGDKSQKAREIALRKFKRGQVNILVATDVVARGIDVHDVSLVINHEPPRDFTDYIHRIGRTGRAGKTGKAVTMID